MFGTIRSFIPQPRRSDQPRRYIGRHRLPEVPTTADEEAPQAPGRIPVAPTTTEEADVGPGAPDSPEPVAVGGPECLR